MQSISGTSIQLTAFNYPDFYIQRPPPTPVCVGLQEYTPNVPPLALVPPM